MNFVYTIKEKADASFGWWTTNIHMDASTIIANNVHLS